MLPRRTTTLHLAALAVSRPVRTVDPGVRDVSLPAVYGHTPRVALPAAVDTPHSVGGRGQLVAVDTPRRHRDRRRTDR